MTQRTLEEPAGPPRDPTMHVVLVEPEIHWNTGNAGRTCLATGARLHLVEPLGFSLDEREVRRAGLDYWARVEPRLWPNWTTFESALAGLGEPWLFSADAPTDYWDADYRDADLARSRPPVLIFGRESTGLAPALRERFADRLLRIPMPHRAASPGPERDGVRSLNQSTSVALAVYEVLRQRRSARG
jgi:tRNA (cytidine/uridine-2'-O-)-methyltransferase